MTEGNNVLNIFMANDLVKGGYNKVAERYSSQRDQFKISILITQYPS